VTQLAVPGQLQGSWCKRHAIKIDPHLKKVFDAPPTPNCSLNCKGHGEQFVLVYWFACHVTIESADYWRKGD